MMKKQIYYTKSGIQLMHEALVRSQFSKQNQLLFSLSINTDLRLSTLLRLQSEDVNGKTTKIRTTHSVSVMTDLDDFLADKPDQGLLFISQRTDKPISAIQAYQILKGGGCLCGHDYTGYRHAYASEKF